MVSEVSNPTRPQFLEKLSKAHHARLARCIVVTGDIHDLFLLQKDGVSEFFSLEELLYRTLSHVQYPLRREDDHVTVLALKSDGFHFVNPNDKKELAGLANEFLSPTKWLKLKEKVSQDTETQKLCADLGTVLKQILGEFGKEGITALAAVQLIGRLLRSVAKARSILEGEEFEGKEYYVRPICIVIDQAETIFPNVEMGRMSSQDRDVWRHFYDLLNDEENIWPDGRTAANREDFIILLSPTVAELQSRIFAIPKVERVNIDLPNEETVRIFVHKRLAEFPIVNLYDGEEDAIEKLVKDARGLSLRTLDDLIISAHRDPENSPLNRKVITAEINKHLELELGETVKFSRPGHSMDDVIAFRKLKPRLRHLVRWIDDPDSAPSGMVVVGPNGAGKTFIIEAWAARSGRVVLTIAGGMKSKWYGETGVFLEKFEAVAARYGKVCIIIDEADDMLKALHDADAHETDKQFVRHLVQMIGNPKYRSKIFWVLITTRPDLLPPDFVRSGRCSLFVPICDPFEEDDVKDFFDWMLKRFERKGIVLSEEEIKMLQDKISKEGQEFSAGDYRKFIDDLINGDDYFKNELHQDFVVKDFIASWKPSAIRIGLERKLQMLLLALNCGEWQELIPPAYRNKNETNLRQEIDDVRAELRFR